jgi:hypothetical protein
MAMFDDDAPPPGYHYVYSGDPSGGGVRFLEPNAPEGQGSGRPIAPHREVAGEVPGTGPSPAQMRFELAQQQQSQQQSPSSSVPSLPEYLANLPREIRDQVMALGEVGLSMFTGMISPPVGAAAGVGKNIYDYITQGKIDPAASKDVANTAAGMVTYQPTLPSAQSILQTMGEAPAYFMGTEQGLPPIVSGINPRALQTPQGTLGALTQGVKRDVGQFSNDVFNAQRGITPGYPTLGTEFSSAFIEPRPSVYEMLAGLEPSRIPSSASAAIKPVGKGQTAMDLDPLQSGMAQSLGRMRVVTSPDAAYYQWRNDASSKLNGPTYDKWETGWDAYRSANKPIDPATGQPHRGSTPIAIQAKLADDYTKIWNEQNRTIPENKLMTPSEITAINVAQNAWIEGPRKKYLETKAGTGVATDPLLAQIESTGFGLQPSYDPHDSSMIQAQADRARRISNTIHGRDPASFKGPIGVGAYKAPLVGTQTATTPMGREFENLMDLYLAANPLASYNTNIIDPDKLKYVSATTPIYDINTSAENPLENIDQKLREELLAGRIKPANIAQIGVERIALQLHKDELARQAKEAKDQAPYVGFRTALATDLPGDTLPGGNKLITFDKALTDKIGEHMLVRALSIDTTDLDHCVAQCGKPPQASYDQGYASDPYRKRHYRPMVVPHTGVPPKEADYRGLRGPDPATGRVHGHTSYTYDIMNGDTRVMSLRSPTGEALITMQTGVPHTDGRYDVKQIMGYQDRGIYGSGKEKGTAAISPIAASDMTTWLNQNANDIREVPVTHALEHLGIVDTDPTKTGSRHSAGIDEVNDDFDFDQIHKILDDYKLKAAASGQPLPPRFLNYDTFKTIINDSDISPYRFPDVTGNNYESNLLSVDNDIHEFTRKRNAIQAGSNTTDQLKAVEIHLRELDAMRNEQQGLLEQQLIMRRAAFAALNTTVDAKLSNLATLNNADPNFRFNVDEFADDYKALAHALVGDVYAPSAKLPDQLHKKIVNYILNSKQSDIDKLQAAINAGKSGAGVLNARGFREVLDLTEPQIDNLSNIFADINGIKRHTPDYGVRDYDPHFVDLEDLYFSHGTVKNRNEMIRNNAEDLRQAYELMAIDPNDPSTQRNLSSMKRNFKMVAAQPIEAHVRNFTRDNTPDDFNIDAYINDRVPPAIQDDVRILSKLSTGVPNEPDAREFSRRYIDEIAGSMYSEVNFMGVYDSLVSTNRYSQTILNNGKSVVKEFAKKHLSPEQFVNFIDHISNREADQLAVRTRFSIPANVNTPQFMAQEIFDTAPDKFKKQLPDIRQAVRKLGFQPTEQRLNDFLDLEAGPIYNLDSGAISALAALYDDVKTPINPATKSELISQLLDPYITYGDINNFLSRLFKSTAALYTPDRKERAKVITILDQYMRMRGKDLGKVTDSFLQDPDQGGYMPPGYGPDAQVPQVPQMARGGRVRRMADGGAVTETLDKMVKNRQASTLLNLDLPNLIAAKRQIPAKRRGGRVEFTHDIDDMRYALNRRRG